MRNIHPTSRIVSCHLSNSSPQCSITPLIPCHSTLLVLIYWLLYVVCILYSLYSTVVTSGSLKCAVEINFGLTKYPNSNHGCAWKLQSKGLYTTSVSEFENVYIKRIHPPKSTLWFKKKKKSVHEATVLFFFFFEQEKEETEIRPTLRSRQQQGWFPGLIGLCSCWQSWEESFQLESEVAV